MWILLAFACRPPDFSPIGEAVGTAAAVGWSAAVVSESTAACVERQETCGDEGCTGTAVIDLAAPECRFPLGEVTTGRVRAVGTWGEQGVMALDFSEVVVDGSSLHASGISAATVMRGDEGEPVRVGYVSQAIGGLMEGETVEVGQDGWSVSVDLADGPAGAHLTINGGGQDVLAGEGTANVAQLAAIQTVLDSACRLNPVSGNVAMEHADGPDAGITGVSFDDTCDGQAKLDASLSLAAGSSGKRFPIPLWQ